MTSGTPNILVLNGPNLNMLGTREQNIYGHETMADIQKQCESYASGLSIKVEFWQSNSEGELVSWIQQSMAAYQGVIINAGAYSHSSIAIMDALKILTVPVIEVHLSNIYKREEFRHHSYISRVADVVICGAGSHGYTLALQAMVGLLNKKAAGA